MAPLQTTTLVHGATTIRLTIEPSRLDCIQELARTFVLDSDSVVTPLELHALFLEHCVSHCHDDAPAVFAAMCNEVGVPATSIHVVVQQYGLDEEAARRVLRAYYLLWDTPTAHGCYFSANTQGPPALFAPGHARLTAMFGGQPGTSNYLEEARWLLDVYGPLLRDYVERISVFLDRQSRDSRLATTFKNGLNLYQWITSPSTMPEQRYVLSAPVSMPLTGFIQIMQVAVLCMTLGVSPGELSQSFKAVAGHSQGIATAVFFSMMSDEASFEELSRKVLGILMLVGAIPQLSFPTSTFVDKAASSSVRPSRSVPRPMIQVRGVSQKILEESLAEFNSKHKGAAKHVQLAVVNTHNQFIVAGAAKATSAFLVFMHLRFASPDEDQSKIPFAQRKPVASTSYVDITVPYHSTLLKGAVATICGIVRKKGWSLDAKDMKLPVRAADDGHDIRAEEDITWYLIQSICVLPVDWPTAISVPDATHIVDFGTGGFGGFGQLAQRNVEGRGVPVICVGALVSPLSPALLGAKGELYQRQLDNVITAPNWLAQFGPRLVRTAHDGKVHIDTRMQRILGAPTVMVAGMTPTTANQSFVAAINHAGYHAELAGGGMNSEEDMERTIKALAGSIEPGQGITLNCIYISPRQWSFQFPELLRLHSKGLPIAGLCIGGGVPSFDAALEIIDSLRSAGIRHVSFKPSTAEAIRHVVRIAQASDGFPIVLQWTGGRAGGHHSYEDFHQPILQTYGAVRTCDNVALVAGSGFGDAEGTLPYLTGDWSLEFGRAPMPFDGILVASRVMVAKEAGTSLAAKELIVAAHGLPDSDWHQTYDSAYGGVTTVTTEFGELNHVLATRAAMFIRDMHATILNQPRDKREALLRARKDEVISRLNTDYLRPWFGKKRDGQVVDLEDMTYVEVVNRLVDLMYIKHQQRWIHPSHCQLVLDFVNRIERRMCDESPQFAFAAYLYDTNPLEFCSEVTQKYPAAAAEVLTSEDAQFFIGLCKRRGQKPVPFIPVLDADFGTLLQKDTIWQSEDMDAVVDQDPQRSIIQQGPVAAQYSTVVSEPVKEILDGIYHSHVGALVKRLYGGNKSAIPVVEYLGAEPASIAISAAEQAWESEFERVFQLSGNDDQLPELDVWLQALSGPQKSWLRALLTTPVIAYKGGYADNYVRQMLRPRVGRTVTISMADGMPLSLLIADSVKGAELQLVRNSDGIILMVVYYHSSAGNTVQFLLELEYCPAQTLTPIHGSKQGDNEAVRRFFVDIWVGSVEKPKPYVDVVDPDMQLENELVITEERSRALCAAVGNDGWAYGYSEGGVLHAPAEFTHVSCMRSMLAIFQSSLFGAGQASIVHLDNKLTLEDGAGPLRVGDTITAATVIDGLVNLGAGKKLTVCNIIYCNGRKYATVEASFLSRSYFIDPHQAFERKRQQTIVVTLPSEAEVSALELKEWFIYCEDTADRLAPNTLIKFCLDSEYHFKTGGVYSGVATAGSVVLRKDNGRHIHIADVDFEWSTCAENPVISYLSRYATDTDEQLFANGGYSLVGSNDTYLMEATAPESNWDYAKQSLDSNPFHLNPYIADFAGLPGTITHGYWTSASTRAVLERTVADGHFERIRVYHTEFVDMVLPQDELTTELFHVGMKSGRMLIRGQTSKVDGGPVMTFTAEVEQPATAYVFTGQGSQAVGMGMDLYEQSPAAQAIWDQANTYMLSTYDIDLLDIVRTNPTEHTVYFNGRAGQQIQRNYLGLSKHPGAAVLPDILPQSTSYTFQSPTGLLNSTQFTQVALVANAMASVADLRSQGLVQKDALFAGHSLGEYAALAALGQILPIEDVLDIVFYRGLIMQSAIPRDEHGRSEYGMVAVNPSRMSQALDEETLQAVVGRVRSAGSGLLQVVNYNVAGQQYVVAGTLTNLAVLRLVLDGLQQTNVSDTGDIIPAVDRILNVVMSKSVDSTPMRGVATIPLDGVDVPFHSEQLAGQVGAFRSMLQSKIHGDLPLLSELCGRYIPNLTAEPFELTREYFGRVYDVTQSPVIKKVLNSWDDTRLNRASKRARLASLLLVELLAYQLASPVQWIGTQEYLFENATVQRVLEVGPSPVLCGMADRTLSRPGYARSSMSVLHVNRDQDQVTYHHAEDPAPVPVDTPATPPTLPGNDSEPVPAPELSAAPTEDSGAGAAKQISDVPLQALDVVHAVVAFKLKQQLSAVSVPHSIKALTGGKSTLQNEIVADLQKEFGNRMPDKPEDIGLQELGAAIGVAGSLGKCTQPLVTRMFSGKMPGGFTLNSARSTLESAYGLGPQRQDALLLVALTMDPASRLSNDAEATAWLEKVAQAYAANSGISYARSAGAATTGAQAQGTVVSSAEVKKLQQQQYEHAQRQIEVLARYAGVDQRKDGRLAATQQAESSALQSKVDAMEAELGDDFAAGILPCFDARKARHFDSSWNWARQDAYKWIQQTVADCIAGTIKAGATLYIDEDRLHRLQIRADQGLIQLLEGTAGVLAADTNPALEPALQLARYLCESCKQTLRTQPVYRELSSSTQPQIDISSDGNVNYSEVPRQSEPTFAQYIEHMRCEDIDAPPFVHLKEQVTIRRWDYSRIYSEEYYTGLLDICRHGLSYAGQTALVTGCGRGSIGADIIRGLLMGGAKVLATTSSYSRQTTLFFEDLYRQFGSRGSELIVVPFNQGSAQDVDALVHYIFDGPSSGHPALGWRLDYVFPFAAISDLGNSVSGLGSRSELALRAALTNIMRLLGCIKTAHESTLRASQPTLAILPLSANHGTFGGDGLYGECKTALETTFNRWHSESWEGHLSIAGADIGWTRGTGLMSTTNLAAARFEELGIRTFSTREMAFNILGLLHPRVARVAHYQPVFADLSGRMEQLGIIGKILKSARQTIQARSDIQRLASRDQALDFSLEHPGLSSFVSEENDKSPLAKFQHHFPAPTSYDSLEDLHHLQDMVNLDKVVVITGYGEVGPHGNAETRWEIEAFGQLSTEGCIELAWIMGLIKHHNGQLSATGKHYVGWVDAKSGEVVRDVDIKPQYEEYILAHTGIRLIEPELVGGYDPSQKQMLREIQIQHDMEPFEASVEDAAAYKKSNGDQVDIWENSNGSWSVRFLKGALIRVPVAATATRLVAGLLPTGWNAERFGIPEDIARQVDPVTLYTLVAVVEALVRSGITDPYQLYQHFHISEVGTTIGSGIGGMQAFQDMFKNRAHDKGIQNDTLQETFISTIQAWVNMLLMSGAGPVKPAVGACATAVLSIDTAVETIQSGKAQVMLAGGVDDFTDETSTEFASMGATSNAVEELANGRAPAEMCRPCTSTRSGFMESQGAGAVVLMSASAALKCGAPIYGVIGMTATATDGQGRSVPAPGKGILGSAREVAHPFVPYLLDVDYRRGKLQDQLQDLEAWRQKELDLVDVQFAAASGTTDLEVAAIKEGVELMCARQRKSIQDTWGNEFWKQNPGISPLRGSLAVWGLTADDIGLASFHGTSTQANDKNESGVFNAQLTHLGRTPGNVVPVVCQKWLTGHPKGAAASFMLNGVLQSLRTGIIPGNRNADNIGQDLKHCDHLLYLSQSIQTSGIKAGLLKSFGFGQVSGEVLVIHPDYLLATLGRQQLEAYNQKLKGNRAKAGRYWQNVLIGKHSFVQVKTKAPYTRDQEQEVYLNPHLRTHLDPETGEFQY